MPILPEGACVGGAGIQGSPTGAPMIRLAGILAVLCSALAAVWGLWWLATHPDGDPYDLFDDESDD